MRTRLLTGIFAATAASILLGCTGESSRIDDSPTRASEANENRINPNNPTSINSGANTVSNAAARITTPDPADFLEIAAQGGMAEVEMGNLASTKATNAEVKAFGRMMATDHAKANAELKALALRKNIPLPVDIGSHKETLEDLNEAIGADFDMMYIDVMVDDHETDVAAFQKQADGSADPDIKAFAAKTLPVLKAHLEKIKAIQAKMR